MEPEAQAATVRPPPPREAYFAAVFDALQDGVILTRFPDRLVVDVNPALCRLLGYARADLLGRSTEALHVDAAGFKAFGELARPAFERGEAVRAEWTLRRRDGALVPVEVSVSPLAGYAGEPIGVVAIVRDLTQARREAAERERLRMLDSFLAAHSIDLISRTGLDGVIRFVSPSCRQLLGYEPHEMVGRPASDFAEAVDLDEGRARQEAAPADQAVRHVQRVRRKDGRAVWMESLVRVVPGEDGRPAEFLAVARDVTERKLAEEALERSEARWRGLAESAPGYIFNVARDGTILFINRVAPGVDPETIVGRNQYDRFSPEDRDRIRAIQERVFETGVPATYEVKAATLGGLRWFQNHVGPISRHGTVEALSVLTLDVTERKEAEEAFRAHRDRLASLITAQSEMGDAILVSEGARIAWVNEAFERLLGLAPGEALSPGFDPLSFVHPDDRAEVAERARSRASGRVLQDHYETRVVRKDGTVVPVEVSVRAQPRGGHVEIVAIFRDASQRKRAEAELEQARAELAQSEKLSALGSLVSGVAHELRTPLTYLSNNIHLLQRAVDRIIPDLPPHRQEEARARIVPRVLDASEGIDRINRLVEDLRRYTRLRGGERAMLDLAPLVDEAVGLFQATHRGQVAVEADLHPTPLRPIDRVQLQQVVLNLIENAREAAPADGVVRVRTRVDARGDPVLEVEDRGPGIPPEVQVRMWDPFFTTKRDGTGLGLSIVKRIVDEHGGRVACESAPGKGTTFRLTLPLGQAISSRSG